MNNGQETGLTDSSVLVKIIYIHIHLYLCIEHTYKDIIVPKSTDLCMLSSQVQIHNSLSSTLLHHRSRETCSLSMVTYIPYASLPYHIVSDLVEGDLELFSVSCLTKGFVLKRGFIYSSCNHYICGALHQKSHGHTCTHRHTCIYPNDCTSYERQVTVKCNILLNL